MKKRSFLSKLVGAPYIVWAAIFIVVPLLMVIYYSFVDKSGGLTGENFTALVNYKDIFLRSVLYSIIATVITLIIGYPFAYAVSRMKPNTQRFMMLLIMLPMWMNLLIRTYSWMNILERRGVINSILGSIGIEPLKMIGTPGAVILGMVYNYLPYMILPIYTVMSKIDVSLFEAADDLGAGPWQRIRRVVMPLSLPGVVSGITMVFVPSVSTFYISQKLGGGKITLIGDAIERQILQEDNFNLGASMSFVLMIMIIVSMAIMNHFAEDDEGGIIV